MASPRRPGLAAVLNLLSPGLGVLYAGFPRRALATAVLVLAALLSMPFIVLKIEAAPFNAILLWSIPFACLIGFLVDGWRAGARAPDPFVPTRWNRGIAYLGFATLMALSVSLVRDWVKSRIEAFKFPSTSMESTIMPGDFLYVAKGGAWVSATERGSLVVFSSVEEPGLKVIKRVVGLPGDTLFMRDGVLFRNNSSVPEPYARHTQPSVDFDSLHAAGARDWMRGHLADPADSVERPSLEDWDAIVVPHDSVFLLGDNRDESYDSRYYGFVPKANVLGRPRMVYFSYDPSSANPWPAFTAARWKRLGLVLSSLP